MLGGDEQGFPFKDFCFQSWQDRYGTKPPWLVKDFVLLAKAHEIMGDVIARVAWKKFLANDEPFNEGHPPGKFMLGVSKWAARASKATPKPKETFPGAARAAAMAKIVGEVARDGTIPSSMKQDEMKRRWKEIPIDLENGPR